ncbi:MAG: hypothetical protein EHM20_04515 [Alphaproteobacteria bacterium]|nr:MAG: hypothetical protein EHM20_04515 [Alphaproteobacteria bacterium]
MKFTLDYTNMLARQLGYKGNLHEFWLGMNFESEHGDVNLRTDTKSNKTFFTTKNPRTNIAFNDISLTARATIAHLEEKPNYYSQLLKMEEK